MERAILAGAAVVAVLPVLLAAVPPLADYPGHLARVHILHDLLTEGRFAAWYRLHWAVVPNLGMDGFVLALRAAGVPIEAAGRIFVAAVVLLLGAGVVRLHGTLFGRLSVVPVIVFAVIYTRGFLWGFMSYLLGLALLLLAFDLWLRLLRRGRRTGWLAAYLAAATAGLFLVHLLPAVLLPCLVLSHEAGVAGWAALRRQRVDWRGALRRGSAVLPAVLVGLALFAATPQAAAGGTAASGLTLAGVVEQLPQRLWRLAHVLEAYSPLADRLSLALLAGGAALAAATGRLRVAPGMVPAMLGLLLGFLAVPEDWAGTSMIAERLPFLILLLAFAGTDVAVAGRVPRAALAGAAVVLLGMRGEAVAAAWLRADRAYAPILAAMDAMPEGSAIYGVMNVSGSTWVELRLPWRRLATMAVVRRDAFSPDVFADATQNLVVIRQPCEGPPFASLANNAVDHRAVPAPEADMLRPDLLARFTHLMAQRPELYQRPLPERLEAVARSGGTVLFRIRPAMGEVGHAGLARCR